MFSPAGGVCRVYAVIHVLFFDKIRAKGSGFFSNVMKWGEFVMVLR